MQELTSTEVGLEHEPVKTVVSSRLWIAGVLWSVLVHFMANPGPPVLYSASCQED